MTISANQTINDTLQGLRAQHVFAEPIERDGTVFLPAAKVRGGAGGGGDAEGNGGAGFGLTAKPAGVYVIRDGDAEWRTAIDTNRIILGGQLVAIVALLVVGSILKARFKR